MNRVSFERSLSLIVQLLKQIGIFHKKGNKLIYKDGVSEEFKKVSCKGDYFKTYKVAITNFDYDFLLKDYSIFQFSYDQSESSPLPELRYAFFQNPQLFIQYEDYLDELRLKGIIENETNEDIGEALFDEYQQFLVEQQLNLSSTTIRYDLEQESYKPLVHAVSHIHVGHLNNVRIPCDKVLTPLKFVLFVIKHIYYHEWKSFIETKNEDIIDALDNAKDLCVSLEDVYWNLSEQKELFLT